VTTRSSDPISPLESSKTKATAEELATEVFNQKAEKVYFR
jgi:hypothetical protein